MIALVVQAEFGTLDAESEVCEGVYTAEKCDEVVRIVTERFSKLGWPLANIVVLLPTSRKHSNNSSWRETVKKQNLILMCRKSWESYMGPMLWGMLQSCRCLANLQLKESAQQSAEEDELSLTGTALEEHKEGGNQSEGV